MVDSGQFHVIHLIHQLTKANAMESLSGEYYHQLDAKNRIRIPSRLKKELGSNYCFVRGENHCVYVYTKEGITKILEELSQIKLSDFQKQKALRAFTRTVVQVAEDGQGRVVLTPELRQHLKLQKDEKEIVVIGASNRAEIWAKSNYDEYFADVDENYDAVLKELGL